jgi:drug/metabolite transporter (DMT)-like permease
MGIRAGWASLPRNVRGAVWMVGSALAYALSISLVKYLGEDYSPSVQLLYRQVVAVTLLAPMMIRRGPALFATTQPWMLLLRSSTGIAAITLGFYSFQNMPLADANALSFTRALWVVPLAAMILREKICAWRIGAALVGFGGVVIMLIPALQGDVQFGLPALAMLGSAFLAAITLTGMKMLTRLHSTGTIMAWAAVLGLAFSLPLALLDWRWPAAGDLVLLVLMGAFALTTQVCYTRGMQEGDAAAMAPIDYTRLVMFAVIGFVAFHEIPTLWTLAGAALVVASTLVITLRELRLAKPILPAKTDA